eukprot:g30486.t1
MPANEASRINQYNMFLFRSFEKLWSFKTYRTPTTLRSVCRVNIQIMPFFFGPYYVHLARNEDGDIVRGRLIFACLFSCLLSTTLVALLNVAIALENPFRPGLDTLRIQEEFYLCREAILTVAREAEDAHLAQDSTLHWTCMCWTGPSSGNLASKDRIRVGDFER